jgi:hypothetical protein
MQVLGGEGTRTSRPVRHDVVTRASVRPSVNLRGERLKGRETELVVVRVAMTDVKL